VIRNKSLHVFFPGFPGGSWLQGPGGESPRVGDQFRGIPEKKQNPIGLLNPFFEIIISVA
jgi:hypothetical protein